MRLIAIAFLLVAAVVVAPARAADMPQPPQPCSSPAPQPGPQGLNEYLGALHDHSAYSDGYAGSIPETYYRFGRCHGLSYMSGSEHSDTLDLPIVANEECIDPDPAANRLTDCANADPYDPSRAFRKWEATQEQADLVEGESGGAFTAFRGFEWSSDRFGHINVYWSSHHVNAQADGSYATLDAFYKWAQRPSALGGGSDGLLTFNHPGDKSLCGQIDVCSPPDDPAFNWNDFAYEPALDDRMVGIEVFNGGSDFASGSGHGQPAEGWYAHALDKGWHLGAVGAEDLGHRRGDDWGGPKVAKTVLLASDQSREALREAMLERRFYALRRPGYRLGFRLGGAVMGSRLVAEPGDKLKLSGSLRSWAGDELQGVELELVTNGGRVVRTSDDDLGGNVRFTPTDDGAAASRWYFMRARLDGEVVAYSSPIWVTAGAERGQWLAGDLHVHTCFSHDVFCGPLDQPFQIEPGDDPADLAAEEAAYVTDPDNLSQIYAYGEPVGMRFEEAAYRGLDYLAITDHNDTRSVRDGGFGAEGVIGIPGYENSIRGHAQVLGARRVLDNGDQSAAAINALADRVRDAGGLLQANHPGYRDESPMRSCADTSALHWQYGYDVRPDSMELWNPTSPVLDAEFFYECWLQRGARIAATGGGDSHWASLQGPVGVGSPTTWVFARGHSRGAVLAAIRAGRTSVSRSAPRFGGSPLLLESADGTAMAGDTVEPGTRMRIASASPSVAGLVTVRAWGPDGAVTLVDRAPLTPGGSVEVTAPRAGWLRAKLTAPGDGGSAPSCNEESYGPLETGGQSISTCAYDQSLLAMTSPVYVR